MTPQIHDGQWVIPLMSGWRMVCCRCSLVHTLQFRVLRKGRKNEIHFRAWRHPRNTNMKTPEYRVWQNMKQRCFNKNAKSYKNYGGRGIAVCRRWMKFENFFADMGMRPAGLTIERKNNERNYCPSNCIWATAKVQARNRRPNLDHFTRPREASSNVWRSRGRKHTPGFIQSRLLKIARAVRRKTDKQRKR